MNAYTPRTMQMMKTVEIRTLKVIHGRTLLERIRSEYLRKQINMQNITKWV